MFAISLLFSSVLALGAVAHPGAHARHAHHVQRDLPGSWYHHDSHPAHKLFVRDATDATTTVTPGTPAWAASYPQSTPDSSQMPQAWKDSLTAAVAAGRIPDYPPSTIDPNLGPVYPANLDPNDVKTLCSATYKCRIPGSIWDAPDGIIGVGFDDGPLAGSSDKLYDFLKTQNVKATHFFIGINIVQNIPQFNYAYQTLQDDIAVHTYTHPYMTSLSNEDVVAQLGYTVQAIRDLTGGRLPAYWRPPMGDADARVYAIAKAVFGLEMIIWNQDTEDWRVGTKGSLTSQANVVSNLTAWYNGPQSPGLIILEHELNDNTVGAFIQNFPAAIAKGWKPAPMTSPLITNATSVYRNAADDSAAVQSAAVALASVAPAAGAAPAGASASAGANTPAGAGANTAAGSNTAAGVNTAAGHNSVAAGTSAGAAPTGAAEAKKSGAQPLGHPIALLVAALSLPFLW